MSNGKPLISYIFDAPTYEQLQEIRSTKIYEYKDIYKGKYCRFISDYDLWGRKYLGRLDIFSNEPIVSDYHLPASIEILGENRNDRNA